MSSCRCNDGLNSHAELSLLTGDTAPEARWSATSRLSSVQQAFHVLQNSNSSSRRKCEESEPTARWTLGALDTLLPLLHETPLLIITHNYNLQPMRFVRRGVIDIKITLRLTVQRISVNILDCLPELDRDVEN